MPLSGPMSRHGNRHRPQFILSGDATGGSWVGVTLPTNYYNAVTQGGLNNTGTVDVSTSLITAINAYKNGGYDGLYFPAGTYKIYPTGALATGSVNSPNRLAIPSGTTFVGEGMTNAHLLGKLNIGSNCSFSNIKVGVDLGATNINGAGGTFTDVLFIGGGKNGGLGVVYDIACWPECDCGVLVVNAATAFYSCTFDKVRHDCVDPTWKFDNVITWGASNILFDHCTFVDPSYFGIEMWASDGGMTHNDFLYCTFGDSVAAQVDYACTGQSYCTVDHCTFGQSGVGPYHHDPGNITIEGSSTQHHMTITNNVMARGGWCGVTVQNGGSYMTITDNVFDLVNGTVLITPYNRSGAMIKLWGSAPANNNVILRNRITAIAAETQYDWAIHCVGDNNTVTGNTVTSWKAQAGYLTSDARNITVTGLGNIVSGNTIT